MKALFTCGVSLFVAVVAAAMPAAAQHPVEVQRLAASGDYFVALTTFERMPRRIATTESIIAAARSAWGLGLASRAQEEFDRALRDEKLPEDEKARLFLSKGIIEYQEGRYQVAVLHAERATSIVDNLLPTSASPLRAKALLLWGDGLSRLGSHGDAEARYVRALDDAAIDDLPQINFSLGLCRRALGKYEAARSNFESVPLGHELTPDAIRNLAILALDTGKLQAADFWLSKGRSDYPDSFLDSWVDYAMMRVAIGSNDVAAVRTLRETAGKKYPPSDQWLTLLQAAAESYEWSRQPSQKEEVR